jgi:diaminohydroxyphosphoribosylaminopyrimidine deaminase / 5-amino-6-(5-phosphoribosylamino)uracil reductase
MVKLIFAMLIGIFLISLTQDVEFSSTGIPVQSMTIPDEAYMQRALELAKLGLGAVSPNPCVGCVLVADGKIIGEGWHRQYGKAHAEVNAVESVENKELLKDATAYVNLEPCVHHGKTPPCADLLIRHQVKKVVVANVDPNPLVGGKGIQKLREAGIDVVVGVCSKEGLEVNKRFFTFIVKQRPYVILKWAQTADGFMARNNYDSKWISNEYSRQLVHKWRSEEDAVLVGKKTAEHDNPKLTVRHWSGRNPVRVVIDRYLQLPDNLYLFDQASKTYWYNLKEDSVMANLIKIKVGDTDLVNRVLQDLHSRNVQSVLIEGGKQTLDLFMNSGFWDEARIFSSIQSFGSGIEAPVKRGQLISRSEVVGDTLEIFKNE